MNKNLTNISIKSKPTTLMFKRYSTFCVSGHVATLGRATFLCGRWRGGLWEKQTLFYSNRLYVVYFFSDEHSYIYIYIYIYIRSDSVNLLWFQTFRVRNLNRIRIFINFGLDFARIIADSVRIWVQIPILIMYFNKNPNILNIKIK